MFGTGRASSRVSSFSQAERRRRSRRRGDKAQTGAAAILDRQNRKTCSGDRIGSLARAAERPAKRSTNSSRPPRRNNSRSIATAGRANDRGAQLRIADYELKKSNGQSASQAFEGFEVVRAGDFLSHGSFIDNPQVEPEHRDLILSQGGRFLDRERAGLVEIAQFPLAVEDRQPPSWV